MRYLTKIALITLALVLVVGGSFRAAQAKAPPGLGGARASGLAELDGRDAQTQVALPCTTAQQGPMLPFHREPYPLDSGRRSDRGVRIASVFRHTIRVSGAPWLRIHFSDYNLGERSYIIITSLEDGGRQRHDGVTLRQWGGSSAFFNGDAVEIELYVTSGEEGIFFRIEEITVGERVSQSVSVQSSQAVETLCGGDDRERVQPHNPRIGRLTRANETPCASFPFCQPNCTAWIGSNGALMTAGHCVDDDPDCDQSTGTDGPLVPDGNVDLDGDDIVEFDVPGSDPDGTVNFADPADQYTVIPDTFEFDYDGCGSPRGRDWAVFAANPNPNTGLLPQHAEGPAGAFFRLTRESPSVGDTLRVTGFGIDNEPPGTTGNENEDSQTQQTADGPYRGETTSGADVYHRHQVDTQGANSGSPIIWEDTGFVIGIHTNGGCTATGGENSGTSFEHDPLESALDDFPGPNTVYVDNFGGWDDIVTTEDGTIFQPYDTVIEGRDNVPAGGIVSIVAGTYSDTLTIDTAMTLVAPVGIVTIGKEE